MLDRQTSANLQHSGETEVFTRLESNVRSYARSFSAVFSHARGTELRDVHGNLVRVEQHLLRRHIARGDRLARGDVDGAREIAAEYFDATRVLTRLIEEAMNGRD